MSNSSESQFIVAIDVMSGDHGLSATIPASLDVLRAQTDLTLILVGDQSQIEQEIKFAETSLKQRIRIQHASEVVDMDEKPSIALRGKKDSSMRVAINLVKEGQAQACVSAGNTGALMATARFVLKMLPGIDRPAISSVLPTIKGHTQMLDLGANVDLSADHLFEFAVMGSVLTQAVDGIENPSVGLLNIGEEEVKGNDQVKQASKLIQDSDLNYYGFVEGDDIFKGTVDVVVCDGFVGNISLKTSEGVAKMIAHYLSQAFKQNIFAKMVGVLALPVLKQFKKQVDPSEYNGASLLGLRGIVIKSHGGAKKYAFSQAILKAITEVKYNVPQLINNKLESSLKKNS